jgi:hypothetical protein
METLCANRWMLNEFNGLCLTVPLDDVLKWRTHSCLIHPCALMGLGVSSDNSTFGQRPLACSVSSRIKSAWCWESRGTGNCSGGKLRHCLPFSQISRDSSKHIYAIHSLVFLLQQQVYHRLQDSETSRIDADALRESRLKLPAQPWTNVAKDGIVSDLVSCFLDAEQPYFCPMLDAQAFISDMTAADVTTARYCSPLLVNAMCAVGAVSGCSLYTSLIGSTNMEDCSSPRSMHWPLTLPGKASYRSFSLTKRGNT